jgi:hypothetical protein
MNAKKLLFLGLAIAVILPRVHAQEKHEIGLVIGATVTPSQKLPAGSSTSVNYGTSLALGAEYDRRVHSHGGVAIYAGVDFLASPFDVKLQNPPPNVIPQYAYVFLTPHVRFKFNPGGVFSPWLLIGGGYARYREAAPRLATSFRQGSNTGAIEFGAGIDTAAVVRVLHVPIGLRLEVRDFYAGAPNYNVPAAGWQNNVVLTGGLLLRFK